MLQVLRQGKGPISWLSITLRLVPVCHHIHFVSQQLMLASIIHAHGRAPGALLAPGPGNGAGYVPDTSLGKEGHANRLESGWKMISC